MWALGKTTTKTRMRVRVDARSFLDLEFRLLAIWSLLTLWNSLKEKFNLFDLKDFSTSFSIFDSWKGLSPGNLSATRSSAHSQLPAPHPAGPFPLPRGLWWPFPPKGFLLCRLSRWFPNLVRTYVSDQLDEIQLHEEGTSDLCFLQLPHSIPVPILSHRGLTDSMALPYMSHT